MLYGGMRLIVVDESIVLTSTQRPILMPLVLATPDAKPTLKRGKPKAETGTPTPAVRGAWTSAEYITLFKHVVQYGPSHASLAHAVPGRSASQSYWTWRQVVEPTCRAALEVKAGQRRR
ncbi:hypothetical protein CC85DRAFT_330815 [Cutaneotrichosporon oleaginosum]|uniref:Myb-like domain-containing protein n=1 Tax=Cutaneotrichosporon oleaginosum TaxID=879819 RepID=A0A0J0XE76_9TREE|nr:uncharacterized protein CC85DRAFT_330815 [Cutaneotrichosporon oleaginosum]KLT39328.1 hypothetical protein CC85DRAFT_330815 [Cutaneotrichosporon oleaginosum]TXT08524.1 hypothetical protein COLE_05448 [Cutaneotrichosporon oleaginosum]